MKDLARLDTIFFLSPTTDIRLRAETFSRTQAYLAKTDVELVNEKDGYEPANLDYIILFGGCLTSLIVGAIMQSGFIILGGAFIAIVSSSIKVSLRSRNFKNNLFSEVRAERFKKQEIVDDRLNLAAHNLVKIIDFFNARIEHFNKYQRCLRVGLDVMNDQERQSHGAEFERLNALRAAINKKICLFDVLLLNLFP